MNDYSQSARGDIDGVVRQYEYERESVVVADFGGVDGSVDVVDGTAIVVVEDNQYEFEVPEGAKAFIRNGVVTIEATE